MPLRLALAVTMVLRAATSHPPSNKCQWAAMSRSRVRTAPRRSLLVARFREFTIPAGTILVVRLNTAVGSDASQVEQPVEATLTDAVEI